MIVWIVLVLAYFAHSNDPYTPRNVSCPPYRIVRTAHAISKKEEQWLKGRDAVTQPVLHQWLSDSQLDGFESEHYSNVSIRVATAVSGGGYRAMLSGAGFIAALDNRTPNSTKPNHMGGLLQASTYLSGLSGASFLVTSMAVEHNTPVVALQASSNLWNFDHEFFLPGGIDSNINTKYFRQAISNVRAKSDAGFNTSFTDLYGRLYAYQLFDQGVDSAANIGWSSIRDYDEFKRYQMPLPVVLSVGRNPNTVFVDDTSVIYEFTPFEFGSWDPTIYSFVDMKYLGTKLENGIPVDHCVNNFDNVAFVTATSTTFFNAALTDVLGILPGFLQNYINQLIGRAGSTTVDVSHIQPNPFFGLKHTSPHLRYQSSLELVDGGEDKQSIPMYPFLQPSRQVDVVFALDLTADTFANNPLSQFSPSGRAMMATYRRQFSPQANHTIFPYVPDDTTFIWGGMINQPTFFGCDRDNLTSLFDGGAQDKDYPPVIIYLANSHHSSDPYYNTFKSEYNTKEVGDLIENGYNIMTQNNGTIDPEWRTCIACAIVLREQQRRNVPPTPQCRKCLRNYCWDGTFHNNTGDGARRDGRSNIVNK